MTAPVGSYPDGASSYGALDMAGNDWEWTADWYGGDYSTDSPVKNPVGPAAGDQRVVGGGGWYDFSDYVRAAFRSRLVPVLRDGWLGFPLASSGF